ncbi:hypothetical protein GCM10027022_11330 [Alpinimonas psychrophila]|uniref:DUF2218 domain-containing protein n=1 Tax=Alpinimonas psychrophila TaxID=748908 RepID=A0A7W3JTH1_9MICO|nr:DUF2218 domain-containing protein [Alpinimonas psychrophila]MBA8828958.1 hypothetical protein [Alpinimonas psychrophila]
MTQQSFRQTANVTIDRPARYGKQLASHIGHKVTVDTVDNGWIAHIAGGLGSITPQASTLDLVAEGVDDASLERIKDVLERHLRKFAGELDIKVDWS